MAGQFARAIVRWPRTMSTRSSSLRMGRGCSPPEGCLLLFWVAKQFFDSFRVPLRRRLQLRVADGSQVPPNKNGVHDGKGASHPKSEAKKKPDDRRPVESHDRWSLSRQACTVQYKPVPTKTGECDASRAVDCGVRDNCGNSLGINDRVSSAGGSRAGGQATSGPSDDLQEHSFGAG